MSERMVRFARPDGGQALIPVGGHSWTNGTYHFELVDSGYVGRTRWAVVNGNSVRYAPSYPKILIECQNEARSQAWRDARHT